MIADVYFKIKGSKKVLADWGSDTVFYYEKLHPLESVMTKQDLQDLDDIPKDLNEYKEFYSLEFDTLVKAGISFSIEPVLKGVIDV